MATKPLGMALRRHENFHTITPYLVVKDAAKAIDFYKTAFGALMISQPLSHPGKGKIVHAELRIGNAPIMLTDEFPEWNHHAPTGAGTASIALHMYVEDADAIVKQAVGAGAKVTIPVADQFYGARSGRIVDPFGHQWIIETQKEELDHNERQQRLSKFLASVP